jgi:hypothetical protein
MQADRVMREFQFFFHTLNALAAIILSVKRLPGRATPILNNKATKEHYTNESDCGRKGGNVHMEQKRTFLLSHILIVAVQIGFTRTMLVVNRLSCSYSFKSFNLFRCRCRRSAPQPIITRALAILIKCTIASGDIAIGVHASFKGVDWMSCNIRHHKLYVL